MTPTPKKDAGGFARIEMDIIDGRERFRVRVGGFMGSWFPKTMEDVVKSDCFELNTAFSSRVKGLIEALEKIVRENTAPPQYSEGPSAIAKKALEEFHG